MSRRAFTAFRLRVLKLSSACLTGLSRSVRLKRFKAIPPVPELELHSHIFRQTIQNEKERAVPLSKIFVKYDGKGTSGYAVNPAGGAALNYFERECQPRNA